MGRAPLAIDILAPTIQAERYTAGLWSLVMYANLLTDRGHDVRLVPLGIGQRPQWLPLRAGFVPNEPSPRALVGRLATVARSRLPRAGAPADVGATLSEIMRELAPHADSDALRRGAAFDRLRAVRRDVDVTLVSASTDVLPAYVHGRGRIVHLMQNYEPWFAEAFDDVAFAGAEAELAFRLPLDRLAIIGWLADLYAEQHVPVLHQAIDLDVFRPRESPLPAEPFTVVSYGGRDIEWKGFRDAAEAIRQVRERVPDLRWRVFGGALLPPENPVAPYEDCGFVTGEALRRMYTEAHVALLPSWFETFPYPPLESMAAGTPVVSTHMTVGDFGRDGENALLVDAKSPDALAAAVLRLHDDPELRARLAAAGRETVAPLTWAASTERLETLLHAFLDGPDPAAVAPGRLGQGDGPLGVRRPPVS